MPTKFSLRCKPRAIASVNWENGVTDACASVPARPFASTCFPRCCANSKRASHKILAEMQAARDRLSELGNWGHGRLRLCTSPTICQDLLPAVLREFKESFPQCVIHIEPGDTPNALDLLRQHRVDLALTLEPREESTFEFRYLFDDELQFLVSPAHPWARSGKVERSEIIRQRFILYTKHSYLYKMIDEYFHRQDIVLPTSIELGNMEAIKELVKLGLGVSILARS